jgi:hypothetical protein
MDSKECPATWLAGQKKGSRDFLIVQAAGGMIFLPSFKVEFVKPYFEIVGIARDAGITRADGIAHSRACYLKIPKVTGKLFNKLLA